MLCSNLRYANHNYTLQRIITLLERNKIKEIEVDGEETKLLFPLLCSLPLTTMVFVEHRNGDLQVIKGKQLLATIKNFIEDKITLPEYDLLEQEYVGKTYCELPTHIQNTLLRTEIPIILFDIRMGEENMKYIEELYSL